MKNDIGVLPDSKRYYYEPDPFTAENLFYAPHAGDYHCNEEYEVSRDYLDTCQIILVDSGSLIVEYRGEIRTAYSGMIVLLDCRKSHRYYAGCSDLRMRWFHFAGNSSQAYTDMILESQGPIIGSADLIPEIDNCCERVLMVVGNPAPFSHTASVALHRLLALLTITTKKKKKTQLESAIDKTADYMKEHYEERDISIKWLAEIAALSSYYYLKKFKDFYGITPHQFLLTMRLRAAKEQLTTTTNSIEEIGTRCGFSNTSHFIMAFRKNTNLTPLQYRTLWR